MTSGAGDQMKVIDVIKRDNDKPRCLIEYTATSTRKWMDVAEIREQNPRLLIDYYESRIIFGSNTRK